MGAYPFQKAQIYCTDAIS